MQERETKVVVGGGGGDCNSIFKKLNSSYTTKKEKNR